MGATGFILARRRAKASREIDKLSGLTVKQLREYADMNVLAYTEGSKKADLIIEISEQVRARILKEG